MKLTKPANYNFKDIEGQSFGRWEVVEYAGRNRNGRSIWTCRCSCGTIKPVNASSLSEGKSTSCGCFGHEQRQKKVAKHLETAFGRVTPEYRSYSGAKNRCTNPNDQAYRNYGGRGIMFCFNSFAEFLEAIGRRPTPKHSLDRIDNDGNYEAGNIRWEIKAVQNMNRRVNITITVDGETLPLKEWASRKNVAYKFYHARLHRLGWCETCTVTLPPGSTCPHR